VEEVFWFLVVYTIVWCLGQAAVFIAFLLLSTFEYLVCIIKEEMRRGPGFL
jgi:hypothetical protein